MFEYVLIKQSIWYLASHTLNMYVIEDFWLYRTFLSTTNYDHNIQSDVSITWYKQREITV